MNSKLLTRITTVTELKQLLTEIILNNTDKVSKISDESVLNAVVYGVAKIAQRQNKDTAIIEGQLFPELATGTNLDSVALRVAGLTRLSSSGSSTFVRVKASEGTVYIPGVNNFVSKTGIQFEVTEITTVGPLGFEYVPVRSINTGSNTNISAQTITTVTPQPIGHIQCMNDYAAVGGRDDENDTSFKLRILSLPNITAKSTLANLLEVIRISNKNVLRIFKQGVIDGKVIINIVTENGVFLTDSEIYNILLDINPYSPISSNNNRGDGIGIVIKNITWKYVDLDFRVDISTNYVIRDVRQSIQLNLSSYLDFRYWEVGSKIQWDDLLQKVKDVDGVNYVPDEYFTPNVDIKTNNNELPRLRGFIMRDMTGNILFDSGVNITPIFYSNGN